MSFRSTSAPYDKAATRPRVARLSSLLMIHIDFPSRNEHLSRAECSEAYAHTGAARGSHQLAFPRIDVLAWQAFGRVSVACDKRSVQQKAQCRT